MEKQEVIAVLSRALVVEGRSLVAYLSEEADLLLDQSTAPASEAFLEVQASTRSHVDRLSGWIQDAGGEADAGSYRLGFLRHNYTTVDSNLSLLAAGLLEVARGLDEVANLFAGLRNDFVTGLMAMSATRKAQHARVLGLLPKSPSPAPPVAEA